MLDWVWIYSPTYNLTYYKSTKVKNPDGPEH